MIRHTSIIVILFVSLFIDSTPAQATSSYCPNNIAVIADARAYEDIVRVFKDVFRDLNCNTEFVAVPAKRGVYLFNQGKVDGELMRLPVIESKYTVPFIRSDPYFRFKLALWGAKFTKVTSLGYLRGLAWHEKFVSRFQKQGVSIHVFNSNEKMYRAFLRGRINGFLSAERMMRLFFEKRLLAGQVALKEVLLTPKVSMYLKPEFNEFVSDLNAYLRKNTPFEKLIYIN